MVEPDTWKAGWIKQNRRIRRTDCASVLFWWAVAAGWGSAPRKPLSFIVKHHVFGVQGVAGCPRIQKVMHETIFFCSMHQLHFPG